MAIQIDLDKPRYDQSTFVGRAKHFFIITNPLNLFATGKQLEEAKAVVEKYRRGENLPGLTEDDIWRAKNLYDSAYHPDTKEKMFILGRMSAQVPMNMTITGCMMTFYKTPKEVIFWQWFNQSFNAIVNYTNRSGDQPISEKQLGLSYVLATGGAVGTALTINRMVKKLPPIVGRLVPFVAVAAANCINIPCMRSRDGSIVLVLAMSASTDVIHLVKNTVELMEGITILDEQGQKLGESKVAAKSAISQVVFSRIAMALPGMMIPPFIMEYLEKKPFMKRMPWLSAPIQVGIVGFFLVFATPLCCALFPQMSSIAVSKLEPEMRNKLMVLPSPPQVVYFNKGL